MTEEQLPDELPEELPEPDVRNDAVPTHPDDPEQTDANVEGETRDE